MGLRAGSLVSSFPIRIAYFYVSEELLPTLNLMKMFFQLDYENNLERL